MSEGTDVHDNRPHVPGEALEGCSRCDRILRWYIEHEKDRERFDREYLYGGQTKAEFYERSEE